MHHHFTVDVEEYYQVSAFEKVVTREAWDEYPSRVEASTYRLMELLAEHGAWDGSRSGTLNWCGTWRRRDMSWHPTGGATGE
jgi:hypothetical protein